MKVGVLSEFIPSKKNKPKCLLAATAFEKVYTSFFFIPVALSLPS